VVVIFKVKAIYNEDGSNSLLRNTGINQTRCRIPAKRNRGRLEVREIRILEDRRRKWRKSN
jgi:hypothetical protein